ncbi:hypothetical protein CORC01_09918 [Colletotrichum orchidophilum]|uniref:Uncharacterized protein n=1 Tax=Colletotrichum orchidophilum TaxID=1209926 RepID=A0A1G4B098_9PEZI|nr:uncharacterized protein CORC01_09918 [Colletotrichum orchidophilum]OHE94811.1 hypothetical protein CORC01_09918 [Colletotrichum orchidophilum]
MAFQPPFRSNPETHLDTAFPLAATFYSPHTSPRSPSFDALGADWSRRLETRRGIDFHLPLRDIVRATAHITKRSLRKGSFVSVRASRRWSRSSPPNRKLCRRPLSTALTSGKASGASFAPDFPPSVWLMARSRCSGDRPVGSGAVAHINPVGRFGDFRSLTLPR